MSQSWSDVVNQAYELAQSLRVLLPGARDQIQALSQLAQFTMPTAPDPEETRAQELAAAAFRRSALTALAQSITEYEPSTVDEARSVMQGLLPLFDQEIQFAGDWGLVEEYGILREMRAVVAGDLENRSLDLPSLKEVEVQESLPSLVLAHLLYRDARRHEEVTRLNDFPHPAFASRKFWARTH